MNYILPVIIVIFLCGCSHIGPVDFKNLTIDSTESYKATVPAAYAKKDSLCGFYYTQNFDKYYIGTDYNISGINIKKTDNQIIVSNALGLIYNSGESVMAKSVYIYDFSTNVNNKQCGIEIKPQSAYSTAYQYEDGVINPPYFIQETADALVSHPKIDLIFEFISEEKPAEIFASFNKRLEKLNLSSYYLYYPYADSKNKKYYFLHERKLENGIVSVTVKPEKHTSNIKVELIGAGLDVQNDIEKQINELLEFITDIISN